MRAIRIGIFGVVMFVLGVVVAIGQQGGGRGASPSLAGLPFRPPAPTDKAVDWQAATVRAGFREMAQKKLETYRILEGGAFNFNMRRETAPEEVAGTHGKKADLYLMQSGEATLTTDGELIDPKPDGGPEGDVDGSGIRNGKSRVIRAGDVVFIPPGVPHQITAVGGEVEFLLFRWDTR